MFARRIGVTFNVVPSITATTPKSSGGDVGPMQATDRYSCFCTPPRKALATVTFSKWENPVGKLTSRIEG